MHARVPIAPRRLGQARHPHPHQGILTTPPGDPHNGISVEIASDSPTPHFQSPRRPLPLAARALQFLLTSLLGSVLSKSVHA